MIGQCEYIRRPINNTAPRQGVRTTVAGPVWYDQSNPVAVVIPPGVVHAYKVTSEGPGWAVNCPNRLYAGRLRREDVDEIRYEDDVEHGFVFD